MGRSIFSIKQLPELILTSNKFQWNMNKTKTVSLHQNAIFKYILQYLAHSSILSYCRRIGNGARDKDIASGMSIVIPPVGGHQ